VIAADLAARSGVDAADIFVHIATSSCGRGNANPMAAVPFFQEVTVASRAAAPTTAVLDADYDLRGDGTVAVLVPHAAVHYAPPGACEIRKLLVFVDKRTQQDAVKTALVTWAHAHCGSV
jgi:hypothetical protein